MKHPTRLLPAEAGHHGRAVPLLYDSSPALLQFMFRARSTATAVLARLYRMRFGHFSHRFAQVATVEGRVVGISLGYGAGELSKESLPGSIGLLLNSPPTLWWHLAARVSTIVAGYVPPPAGNSFYLNNLAVDPNFQGSGIGRALLLAACSRAWDSGHRQVELDVSSNNAGAITLYQQCGFGEISRTRPDKYLQKYALPTLLRMRKDI